MAVESAVRHLLGWPVLIFETLIPGLVFPCRWARHWGSPLDGSLLLLGWLGCGAVDLDLHGPRVAFQKRLSRSDLS